MFADMRALTGQKNEEEGGAASVVDDDDEASNDSDASNVCSRRLCKRWWVCLSFGACVLGCIGGLAIRQCGFHSSPSEGSRGVHRDTPVRGLVSVCDGRNQ